MKYEPIAIAPKYERIRKLLKVYGFDGAIVSSPENMHYTVGFSGHQHVVSRQPGFAAAVLSADNKTPVYAITMDYEFPTFVVKIQDMKEKFGRDTVDIIPAKYHTWVGAKTWEEIRGLVEPTVPDSSTEDSVLRDAVRSLGLENKRIGLELDYLSQAYTEKIRNMFPGAEFGNISSLFLEARQVKTEDEIRMFRKLCSIADEGFFQVSTRVRPGVTERDMAQVFRESVIASGFCIPSSWSMFSTGPSGARLSLPGDAVVKPDHVFKFDAGVNAEFDFYTTDTSRAWVMPEADPELFRLKDRLYEGQRRMIEAAKPGMTFHDLYHVAFDYVKKQYPCYERGHMGHSISMGPQTAETPIISDANETCLKAGMVLAMEVPCYIQGYNGFNIEDMVLITENGCEVLTPRTPHYL